MADTAHTKYNRIFVVTDEDLGDHSAGRRQLLFAQRPLQAVANPCRLPPGCFCMMAQAAGLLPMMVNRAGTTSSAALILLALAGGLEHQLDEYLSELLLDVFLKAVASISSPLPPRTGWWSGALT